MYLLLQLHAPLDAVDRTLYLFGCNNASCHSGESGEMGDGTNINRFNSCIGNEMGGEMRCVRSQQQWKNSKTTSEMPMASSANDFESPKETPGNILEENDWGVDDGSDWGDDGDDDWGGGAAKNTKDNTNISMDDLETMLTNCEMHSASKEPESAPSIKLQSTSTSGTSKARNVNSNTSGNPSSHDIPPSFEHHDLEMIDEPPTGRGNDDSDEDDDDDAGIDASKVDQMLSRYLDTEDDEEILSCLKGGGKSSSGGNNDGKGGGGERYERLPPEERAFLAFSKRLKRVPGQVARYAYGGVPLWSIPLPPKNTGKLQQTRSSKQQKSKKKAQKVYSPLPVVPPCVCGAKRVFEFQILPSLLHVLDVDAYATAGSRGKSGDMMDLISRGGMDWGSIAVYSCSESCDKNREEFIIVQGAVCDAPVRNMAGTNGNSDDDDMDGN